MDKRLGTKPEVLDDTCWLCKRSIDRESASTLATILSDGSRISAHGLCVEALRRLLGSQENAPIAPTALGNLVRSFNGEWILTNRQFANEYVPILVFFSLSRERPKSLNDLRQWLTKNDVHLSNPATSVARLVDKSSLTVIVEQDGTKQFLITDKGEQELTGYVKNLTKEVSE